MNLYEGQMYWDQTVVDPLRFEKLGTGTETQVLIIGGGITGNLCAHVLAKTGLKVLVAEKGHVGRGSSLANTGLLQYRSDKMLIDFMDDIGPGPAYLFYRMCLEAMDQLTDLNRGLTAPTDYSLRDTIYFASSMEDTDPLRREYRCLKRYGFPVELLEREELKQRYRIDKPAALRTWHDAEVNPYRMIQALVRRNLELGVRYYENTELDLDNIHSNTILTRDGHPVGFDYLILTTGYTRLYETIKDRVIPRRTYAFCSEPVGGAPWPDNIMIWETSRPYLYLRTTADSRIIAGGLDEDRPDPETNPDQIRAKARLIADQVEDLFPYLKVKLAYAWNGLFCGSTDGLPFIGPDPNQSNILYLLGYEGNGMCYSMAGAAILTDYIQGRPNPYQSIVRLDR